MDAQQIRGLQPMLARFLKRFDDCFARKDTRAHLSVYVNGQKMASSPVKEAQAWMPNRFADCNRCLPVF